MKTKITLVAIMLTFIGWSHLSNAQAALFKDLAPGTSGVGSQPEQFTVVGNTMYFITDHSINRRHALWKSDGTVAGTVIAKDSIITTAVTDRFMIRGHVGDTLYYTVNENTQSDTTTELWMVKNGSAPVLVTELTSRKVNQFANGEPRQYVTAGGKLYFQMYTDHGYELWVSDGSAAGTHEVIDLFPGTTSGIANGGANPVPMIEYNGKVYFQGITSFSDGGLYSSDGSSAGTTLVKGSPGFDPKFFTVYNNELYFQASSGLWKTDGTTAGTVNINNIGFNSDVRIFQNKMYYSVGSSMYQSDGTAPGTVVFKDSVGVITGMNNDYFLARYMRTFSVAPYYEYYYWRSDGTAAGTLRVADSLITASSFVVLNNKMYSAGTGTALWESDGTDAGTRKVFIGVTNYPTIFNNTVFFNGWKTDDTLGYELYSFAVGGSVGIGEVINATDDLNIYPNPTSNILEFRIQNSELNTPTQVQIFDITGKLIRDEKISSNRIDVSEMANGFYVLSINSNGKIQQKKFIVQH
jgi:ELWxxDGT repeat protein